MQKSTYLFHKFQYISTQTCPNCYSKIVYKKYYDTICKKHDSFSQFLVNIHSKNYSIWNSKIVFKTIMIPYANF
jgi:hypothetical protein